MIIVPNYVYLFTFKSLFSTLNGIYRVESISSYSELISSGVDLYKETYQTYGATDDMFKADLDIIRSENIAKLVSVNDETKIIFIPVHLFDTIPNGSVQKYYQLGLVVTLGIFDDPEEVTAIKNEVDQIVSSMTGIVDKTTIFTVKNVWMDADDYKLIAENRESSITRISNHFTDKQTLLRELDSLKTRIIYYENLIKTISVE